MDQEWKPRQGALLRLFAFWPRVFLRIPGVPKCACEECSVWAKKHGPDAISWASDHLRTWSADHVAVMVPPFRLSNGA